VDAAGAGAGRRRLASVVGRWCGAVAATPEAGLMLQAPGHLTPGRRCGCDRKAESGAQMERLAGRRKAGCRSRRCRKSVVEYGSGSPSMSRRWWCPAVISMRRRRWRSKSEIASRVIPAAGGERSHGASSFT